MVVVVVVVVVVAAAAAAEVQMQALGLDLNPVQQYHPKYQCHRLTYFASLHVVLLAVDRCHLVHLRRHRHQNHRHS